jgi:rhodanese-related sulfurtransferase
MKTLPLVDPAQAKVYFDNKLKFTTGPVEVEEMIKSGANIRIIDVRAAEDYAKGHVPTAVNLPEDQFATLEGISKDKTNIIYCYNQQCHLGAKACREFASNGFPVMEMDGGFEMWKERDLEIDYPSENRLAKLFHGLGKTLN